MAMVAMTSSKPSAALIASMVTLSSSPIVRYLAALSTAL